jgi:hypothetical protein
MSGAMVTLRHAVRVQGGVLFPKGEAVQVKPVPGSAIVCEIFARGMTKRVHYVRVFQGPTRNLICAWIARNVCKSVIGEAVQPGGFDRSGFPCWSLVYQMQLSRGI